MNVDAGTGKIVLRKKNGWPLEPVDGTLGKLIRTFIQEMTSEQLRLIYSLDLADQVAADNIGWFITYIRAVQDGHYCTEELKSIVAPYGESKYVSDILIPDNAKSLVINSIMDMCDKYLRTSENRNGYIDERMSVLRAVIKKIGY